MWKPVLYVTTSPLGAPDQGDHECSGLLNRLLVILYELHGGGGSKESLLEGWPAGALLCTTDCLSSPYSNAENSWSPRQLHNGDWCWRGKGRSEERQGTLPCLFSFFFFLIAHVIFYTVWKQEQLLYKYIYRFVFLLLRLGILNFNFQIFAAFVVWFHSNSDVSITMRWEGPQWNEREDSREQKVGWRVSIDLWLEILPCGTNVVVLNLHQKTYTV